MKYTAASSWGEHQAPHQQFHDFFWWLWNWPIEIDGLPINSMVIFHGYVSHNQWLWSTMELWTMIWNKYDSYYEYSMNKHKTPMDKTPGWLWKTRNILWISMIFWPKINLINTWKMFSADECPSGSAHGTAPRAPCAAGMSSCCDRASRRTPMPPEVRGVRMVYDGVIKGVESGQSFRVYESWWKFSLGKMN